ncbi:hypothetical protein NCCP1664_00550 [Zafaria cholistanensis]|uniref:Transmembrane protein n=1 Tax=Zafaria cholistanensis TaxID=1682741 RepID=A0A5A7NP73_9MICC|nr:hypothetical protein [Zafaria cholistanensis]GER21558.1 hypothetical protein NCCP1664_00550 [Zafaria cholistanensis]
MRTKTVAGSALAAVALIVAASQVGPAAAAPVAVWALVSALSLLFAAGWPRLFGLPAATQIAAVLGAAGLAAAAGAALAPMPQPLFWMAPAAAVGLILAFLVQLLRGTGEKLRLESMLSSATGALVVASGSGWIALDRIAGTAAESSLMVAAGASMAAAILVCTIRWPDRIVGPLAVVVAVLVGGLATLAFGTAPLLPALAVGAVSGAVIAGVRSLVVSSGGPRGTLAAIATGLCAVLGSGTLAYFLERLLLG